MGVDLGSVEVGFQVFLAEGAEEFGAVREVNPDNESTLTVYVENAGDFIVPAAAVSSVHHGKVILDASRLDEDLLHAIAHAHDEEQPGS